MRLTELALRRAGAADLEEFQRREGLYPSGQEDILTMQRLTPLLLGLEEPLCPEFAQILRDRWATRWPRDPYQTAAYADINSGFRYAIMGIPMQPPKDERQDP